MSIKSSFLMKLLLLWEIVMVMIIGSRSSDFVNHLYDYRPNWTPLSPITIINMLGVIGRIFH